MFLNANSKIICTFHGAVDKAVSNLKRDMDKVFLPSDKKGGDIVLIKCSCEAECFILSVQDECLELSASDELGFIYGIYEISRRFLHIENFWFWNDQRITQTGEIDIPVCFSYQSKPFAVRYRGWFINDEVLLHKWTLDQDNDKPWEMAMETLLRCGGN